MLNKKELLKLPIYEKIDLYKHINILIEASKNIGIFEDMLQRSKIEAQNFISPLLFQEATQSTRIEGTQATLDEVMESKVTQKCNKDVQEVKNYYQAVIEGKKIVKKFGIGTRTFRELHKIIMSNGVRGSNRAPGEIRNVENWIGPENSKKENASYVPPSPEKLDMYLKNLDEYINDIYDESHFLIKLAIIHVQFESIHPFLDGNGRIGRILIPLYLHEIQETKEPNFFISNELEKDKYKYYQYLNNVRYKDAWDNWINFFISTVNKQALHNIEILKKVDESYEKLLSVLQAKTKNNKIIDFARYIYKNPVFNIKQLSEEIDLNKQTTRKYVNFLVEKELIYSNGVNRNKIYFNYNLLELLR